jgi:menaquinone-dependent protoporphyrinogen oxidase
MKTLILYDSKTGFTKSCAEQIHAMVDDSYICDINGIEYNINDYDTILIGAPIYAGKIKKNVAKFIRNNKIKLLSKKLGIFCAGIHTEEFNKAVQNSIPPEIFYNAQIIHCGGKITYPELSFLDKLTLRRRLGIKESTTVENKEEMLEFIQWVKSDSREKIR